MNDIQIFNNPNFGEIRTVINENGEPMFCLVDVCAALELTPKGVKQRLGDEVISNYPIIDTLGREQQALFVNEDGLYDTVLESRIGKLVSSWCRRMGVLPEKIKHERWGFVNTYPMQALRDVFKATFPDKSAMFDVPTYWG